MSKKTGRLKHIARLMTFAAVACGLTVAALSLSPPKASADICSVNGRDCHHGYFSNVYDGGPGVLRNQVFPTPALSNIFDVEAFLRDIGGRLGGCAGGVLTNPNDQNQTGAAFIILTMLGAPPGTPKDVACQRYIEWATLVRSYAAAGLVNFNQVYNFGGINTRSTRVDVAYYPNNGSALSIVFYSPINGQPLYAIKKDCGNPVGRVQALVWDYNLNSSITPRVNGGVATTAEPGDSINFEYAVNNTGRTASNWAHCYGGRLDRPGYHKPTSPPEPGGTLLSLSCPRASFGPGRTVVGTEAPLTAVAGMSYCRTLFVHPMTASNPGIYGTEVCINVISRPYLMVFGGDVKAGGSVETAPGTCSNPQSSIVAWNKHYSGYTGAGTQFAAMATGIIKAFTSAQYSPPGGASMPVGLSFASSPYNQAAGIFGGQFGTAPCIKDHYAAKPATTSSLPPNVSSLTTGDFAANASTVLEGGNVNPGQKTTVYVDGDLFISSNITYAGSWAYNNIPMLKVVVRGNIFISSNVTRLDGIYVAQPLADSSKGYVYTCATDNTPPFTPLTLTGGAFFNTCSTNKLTVNGSVVASAIQFLRTSGTVEDSNNAAENRLTNRAAEVFNYGPGFWITQPTNNTTNDGEVGDYDAITSLPPVL